MNQDNNQLLTSPLQVDIDTNTLHGRKLWIGRISYSLLFLLILSFLLIGKDVYYKYLILRSSGIDASLGSVGEIILHPLNSFVSAVGGVREGDTLLSVNSVRVDPNLQIHNAIQNLSLIDGGYLRVEVRGTDGINRQIDFELNTPRAQIYNLSILQVTHYLLFLDIILLSGFLLPSLIIFIRKSNDWMGLFVALTLLLTAFRFTRVNLFVLYPVASLIVFVLHSAARIMLLIFLFTFPDGRFVPGWSRYFVWIGGTWAGLSLFFPPFYGLSGQLLDLVIFAVGMWAQVYRYRHVSNIQVKQQTKWIIFGLLIAFFFGYLLTLIQFLPILRDSGVVYLQFQLIGQIWFVLSLLAFPITVSISIFRYHLYDIDTLINRALVYGTLTAIISGLAVAMTGFFQRLFLTFSSENTEIVVVIITLVVATAITPLKSYLQSVVDKYFKEAPNVQKKLDAFVTQIDERLSPVEARQVTRRLLEETVSAYDAIGGMVTPVYSAPAFAQVGKSWDGDVQIEIPIQNNGKIYGMLALGKRNNGAAYTPKDRELLQTVANHAANAIAEDDQI